MAMATCRECKKEVSDTAETCPNCGAKSPAKGNVSTFVSVLVISGVVLGILFLGNSKPSAPSDDLEPVVAPEPAPPIDPATLIPHWNYNQFEDPMSGGTTKTAEVYSMNTFEFDSPYSGPQQALLTLRQHPRYGKDAFLTIERGQLLCRPYNDCEVTVRFGEGKPQSFSAVKPDDNSSTALFIANYQRFLRGVKGSKIVRISAPVYQEGNVVFEFDTTDLKW